MAVLDDIEPSVKVQLQDTAVVVAGIKIAG